MHATQLDLVSGYNIFLDGERFGRGAVQLERGGQLQEFRGWVWPQARPRFRSPLVNASNIQLSGDDGWEALLERVVFLRKPIAFLDSHDPTEMLAAERRATAAGCAAERSEHHCGHCSAYFCTVAIPGTVGGELDVEALVADYRDLTRAASPALGDAIAAELRRLASRELSSLLAFEDVESDGTPAGYARCGLLLGYPVETTAALIGTHQGLRGCWTGKLGRFGRPASRAARGLVHRFMEGYGRPAEAWLTTHSD